MSKEYTTLELDLTIEEIAILALAAHERKMTLNDFIVKTAVEYAERTLEELE